MGVVCNNHYVGRNELDVQVTQNVNFQYSPSDFDKDSIASFFDFIIIKSLKMKNLFIYYPLLNFFVDFVHTVHYLSRRY